ncbi:hypothetical protein LAZ67_X002409 [Cordylochernes scorpioides]|uniref:Transposase n=1 Tax=Cordylochernes scorpioides TaxID=51811 RepID=A0ABY6LTD6_9ARAC|nr:hypothetical protein LAZ67_X002409 [Cordylochernes scorpioides]
MQKHCPKVQPHQRVQVTKWGSGTFFLFKSRDISATTIHLKLQPVYGNETLDRSTIQRWVQCFHNGYFDLHDETPGKPSNVTTDQNLALVEEIVKNNWTITTYQLMAKLFISKNLIESYMEPASESFKGIKMCDEAWVYHYDPSSKHQSMQWTHKMSPVKKIPRLFFSKDKIMITVFWGKMGLYSRTRPKKAISTKRPSLKGCQIKFHQDNARPHTAQQTLAHISRYGWTLMPHPAYSPDLASSEFYLFGKLKNSLSCRKFENDELLLHEVGGCFRNKM